MNYLALYRKYRPSNLDEMVGQREIRQILVSSIKNNMISHAYLFSGPRGTGKTTAAKILAKMVNCEHPVDGMPCNNCNSCLNVLSSNDIIEIDAASNNGVEEIRNLRDKASLVPTANKYKVYIIDEVHMLTPQAFNALLKTLEEPPKHVIFILATTEYYKIPLTISSRCQKFLFNKIDNDDIVFKLKEIINLENIKITEDALYEIAKASDGGMRDSINLLDQLRSFTSDEITIDDVYIVCGSVTVNDISMLLIDIKQNNVEKVATFLENVNNGGKNYSKFLEDMLLFLKDVVLFKNNVSLKVIKTDINYLKETSKLYSLPELFSIIDLINELLSKLKYVSRQPVIVITNFLLLMNTFNTESKIDKDNNTDKEEIDNYEMAFNFTSGEVNHDEVVSNFDLQKSDVVNKKNNNTVKNIDNIINNAFAVADKMVKVNLQNMWTMVNKYLTDKKYSIVAGKMIDLEIQVAGDNYIIFTGAYDSIVENVYVLYDECLKFLAKIFGKKYYFAVITNENWQKYKEEYINNIKHGKKYELIEQNEVKKKKISTNKATAVDKLFDIVGTDDVVFK